MADQDSLQRYQDSVRAAEAARRQAEADAAARAEAAAAERARAAARATLEQVVLFDYDRSEIRDDQQSLMREKAEILRNSPSVQLRITGHADERGSEEYNIALGNRRAAAVRDFFAGFGLAESRFSIVSRGEYELVVQNASSEAQHQRNRRAAFDITAGASAINPGN